ncbi:hypothetical protein NDU88_003179 [Pleurodeles waltl]|uniref:Uncharacterized protein n=1 Tax=Pleurodeles waltl TaxID=8319 RepID=A0AAV7MRQ4_PLEWA|nr:hypothetical protein NDU88_003179 [Pleurodeles waltl]
MEKGVPSPISPRHCRVRRRSSRCGLPLLTRGSDVGGAALHPSSGLTPLLLHYGATAPLRLQPAPARPARGHKAAPHRGTPARTEGPAGRRAPLRRQSRRVLPLPGS